MENKVFLSGVVAGCMVFAAHSGLLGGNDDLKMVDPPKVGVKLGRDEKSRAQSALMYINHLNHVVAKLNDMNDIFVLQQEYENLTDDNLNLESIHDETTVQLVVQLMDQLHNLQENHMRSVQAQVAFEREKRGAIWKALPQPAVFLTGGDPYTLAIAIGGAALTSVQNYYNAQSEAELKFQDKGFEIAKDKLAYINEINKELFLAQWRLVRDYGLSDRERVTREESRMFLGFASVLKNGNGKDVNMNRLVHDIFEGHVGEMKYLPFYWITRATAANTIGDYEDLKMCCERFFALYQNTPIVRKDMDACAMALLYVSTMLKDRKVLTENDRKLIREWLKFVEDTVRIPEWQTKFSVAMIYKRIGDDQAATRVLQMTLSEVYACIKVWEKSGKTNIFRKTPALEKAYGDLAAKIDGLPNWREEAERMVPYDGYVWTAGALYSLGEKDVFNRLPCDDSHLGASKHYIIEQANPIYPSVNIASGVLSVSSNGMWEPGEDSVSVAVYIDGRPCERGADLENGAVRTFGMRGVTKGREIIVSVRSKFGINAQFTYSFDRLKDNPKTKFVFPWTM